MCVVFYRQLTALIDMYTSTEISEHLLPITLSLAEDKVAEVRHMAFRVVSRHSLIIDLLTAGGGGDGHMAFKVMSINRRG